MLRRDSAATMGEHDEQARKVRDTIIEAIVTMDERGTIETVNAATERLFGYRAHELLGQNVKILMPPPYRDEHDRYLAQCLKTEDRRGAYHRNRARGDGAA
jgi:PAS domain S-box-containing protein